MLSCLAAGFIGGLLAGFFAGTVVKLVSRYLNRRKLKARLEDVLNHGGVARWE